MQQAQVAELAVHVFRVVGRQRCRHVLPEHFAELLAGPVQKLGTAAAVIGRSSSLPTSSANSGERRVGWSTR